MTFRLALLAAASAVALSAQPPLAYELVRDWAQLPKGWNFGECAGVAVDARDNVWVFHRGLYPVIQFDRSGKLLQAWKDVPVTSPHGIKVDPEGNVWAVDVYGHRIIKFNTEGRVLMVITNPYGQPGDNDAKYAFNRPTAITFTPAGDFFYVSDGYVNSRVVKYTHDGEYVAHWGKKGTGPGEFDIAHDVCLDARGRVYAADRTNKRIHVYTPEGQLLKTLSGMGSPWGLAYSPKDDTIFMADGYASRVVKINLEGQVLGTIGSFGKVPGKFDFCHHIALDSTGALYVAEIKNWRVQKFVPKP